MSNYYFRFPSNTLSGTVNVGSITGPIALPTGASTYAAQTDGSQQTQIVDGLGNVVGTTGNALDVNISSGFVINAEGATGAAVPAEALYIAGNKAGNLTGLLLDGSGFLETVISAALPAGANTIGSINNISGTISLPTGASTYAAQTDGSQKSQIVNSTGLVVGAKTLATGVTGTDVGIITNSVIHGVTTGGGGGYVDVKVTPSGALVTDTTITGLDAAILGQATMANSLPVVIASNQSAVAVSASSLPLPSGAATASNQTTLGSQTTKINDGTNTATVKAASTAAQATDTALVVAVSPNNTVAVSAASLPLPSGAATSINQTNGSQKTQIVDSVGTIIESATFNQSVSGGTVGLATVSVIKGLTTPPGNTYIDVKVDSTTNSLLTVSRVWDGTNTAAVKAASTAAVAADPALVVAVSPNNTIAITRKGSSSSNAPVYNLYSSTSITTAAYTQLVASTTSATNYIDIFDSSGQAMILATGAAGAETVIAYIPPGGGSYQVAIAASTRVAYKALTGTANSGYLLIDFWS